MQGQSQYIINLNCYFIYVRVSCSDSMVHAHHTSNAPRSKVLLLAHCDYMLEVFALVSNVIFCSHTNIPFGRGFEFYFRSNRLLVLNIGMKFDNLLRSVLGKRLFIYRCNLLKWFFALYLRIPPILSTLVHCDPRGSVHEMILETEKVQ